MNPQKDPTVAVIRCRGDLAVEMADNPAWVQIKEDDGKILLSYRHRLEYLSNLLPTPTEQYPSIIYCIGKHTPQGGASSHKDKSLRYLFPRNALPSFTSRNNFANIFLDEITKHTRHPLLFAEHRPGALGKETPQSFIREKEIYKTPWRMSHIESAVDSIHSKLLFQFSNVVCVFADDFDSMKVVLCHIRDWAIRGNPCNLPRATRPRVLVIKYAQKRRQDGAAWPLRQWALEDLEASLGIGPERLRAAFSSVHKLEVVDHTAMRTALLRALDIVRHRQALSRVQFNAPHLAALFGVRFRHFCVKPDDEFDFVHASREGSGLPHDYQKHLSAAVALFKRHRLLNRDIARVLASSVLMDAYSPRSHKFNAIDVFETDYVRRVRGALNETFDPDVTEYLLKIIRGYLSLHFDALERGEGAEQIHMQEAKSLKLGFIRSNRCCLYCFSCRPEHVLACGHAICDDCVRRFAYALPSREHSYLIVGCYYCPSNKHSLAVHLKPPTAGVRVLSIDGGGVRGIVPLQYLSLLQKRLGRDCRVQELFDVAIGTSAGGLIVLGLFARQWTVDESITKFSTLTRSFFGTKRPRSLVRSVHKCLKSLVSDGIYDAAKLEQSLQESFSVERKLFSYPLEGVSRAKIGVIATTTEDATAVVLSNYNGIRSCKSSSGYTHPRARDPKDEVTVWQAARATSAAPAYFKPALMDGIGTLQDGCLKHNNPIRIALWEVNRIWQINPLRDLVLSLGTGTSKLKEPSTPTSPPPKRSSSDALIPRLFRSFSSSIDGESLWRDIYNGLTGVERPDYVRLNVNLEQEPAMDDTSSLDMLKTAVQDQADSLQLQDICATLVASSFYFELLRSPTLDNNTREGGYQCVGRILCRGDPQEVLSAVDRVLPGPLELVVSGEVVKWQPFEPRLYVCCGCSKFSRHITFRVRHLRDKLVMGIKRSDAEHPVRRLSGFPESMEWFTHAQKLRSPFGRRGESRPMLQCANCDSADATTALMVKKRKPKQGLTWADAKRKRSLS